MINGDVTNPTQALLAIQRIKRCATHTYQSRRAMADLHDWLMLVKDNPIHACDPANLPPINGGFDNVHNFKGVDPVTDTGAGGNDTRPNITADNASVIRRSKTITVSASLKEQLEQTQADLSIQFGFALTMEQTLLHLLAKWKRAV